METCGQRGKHYAFDQNPPSKHLNTLFISSHMAITVNHDSLCPILRLYVHSQKLDQSHDCHGLTVRHTCDRYVLVVLQGIAVMKIRTAFHPKKKKKKEGEREREKRKKCGGGGGNSPHSSSERRVEQLSILVHIVNDGLDGLQCDLIIASHFGALQLPAVICFRGRDRCGRV